MPNPLVRRLAREFFDHLIGIGVVCVPLMVFALVWHGIEGLCDMAVGAVLIGSVLGIIMALMTWLRIALGYDTADSDLVDRK